MGFLWGFSPQFSLSVLWAGKTLPTEALYACLWSVWLKQMRNRLAVVVVASIVGLGACTTVGSSPATAPPITDPPVTTSTVIATTTTTLATTTTFDRVAEIQAIFQDLEVRRLQAIMDQDEPAFRAVFANDEYEERSMVELDLVEVIDPNSGEFRVLEIFFDGPRCIAVGAVVDASQSTAGGGLSTDSDYVAELAEGRWGYSWVGEGWRCDGPHPFSD